MTTEELIAEASEKLSQAKELLRDARGEHLKTHALGSRQAYFGQLDWTILQLGKMRSELGDVARALRQQNKANEREHAA